MNVRIIGRERPADVVIDAPQVSARHASIEHLGGGTYRLTDLGSSNGTWVNDQRIETALATVGDRVRFGSCPFDLTRYNRQRQAAEDAQQEPPRAARPWVAIAVAVLAAAVAAVLFVVIFNGRDDTPAPAVARRPQPTAATPIPSPRPTAAPPGTTPPPSGTAGIPVEVRVR